MNMMHELHGKHGHAYDASRQINNTISRPVCDYDLRLFLKSAVTTTARGTHTAKWTANLIYLGKKVTMCAKWIAGILVASGCSVHAVLMQIF